MTKYIRYILISTLFFSFVGCSVPVTQVTAETNSTAYLQVPSTDCEIRKWYNYQVVAISVINKRWKETGIALKERAKKAFALRHNARVNARYMMKDREEVKSLQERDKQKYGNPDGPTFVYLVQKLQAKGLSEDEVYREIIESSSRTNKSYNAMCQK